MSDEPSTSHFERLIDRIRNGDASAKDDLVNDAYTRVQRLTHLILRGEFHAGPELQTDDIVNSSLLKFTKRLREGLEHLPINSPQLFSFVGTIIRRTVLDEIRKLLGPQGKIQAAATTLPVELCDPKAAGFDKQVLDRLAWQEEIDKLPQEERDLLDARYLFERSYKEIAADLGCDPRTVSTRLLAILRKLRQRLADPE